MFLESLFVMNNKFLHLKKKKSIKYWALIITLKDRDQDFLDFLTQNS